MSSENNENVLAGSLEPVNKGELPLLSQVFPTLANHRLKDWPADALDEERLQISSIEYQGVRWYNVEQLRNAELAWLEQKFKLNPLHLEDITSHSQRPKIDDYEDYLFIVLHFPIQAKPPGNMSVAEVDILYGPDYIITIHDGRLTPLKKLFEQCRKDPKKCDSVMTRTSGFLLYSIIDLLIEQCFPLIDNLADKMELIDEEIFKGSARSTIYYISALRREIIALRRVFKPQLSVIANLEHRHHFNEPEEIEAYFSDLSDHISKIWDNLEEFKEIIEGLSATYDSLTSHRLNQIIKTLTIISVILMPLTLVTGIFGMNVPLPLQNEPWTFILLAGLMVATAVGLVLFFRSRNWL